MKNVSFSMNIFLGTIARYVPSTGDYYVIFNDGGLAGESGVYARMISPSPYLDGGGLRSAPEAPQGSQCLLCQDGTYIYILGFVQPPGFLPGGTIKPTDPIEAGELAISNKTRTRIKISADGTLSLGAGSWALAVLNPVLKRFTAFFKTIVLNFFTGQFKYMYDAEDKGRITFRISKDLSLSKTKPASDVFYGNIGNLSTDTHMIQAEVKQNFTLAAQPTKRIAVEVGVKKSGELLSIITEDGNPSEPKAATTTTTISSDASLTYRAVTKSSTTSLKVSADKTSLDVNGKASLTIDSSGKVTIVSSNISLGDSGASQQLMSWSKLKSWLENHQHTSGATGATTAKGLETTVTLAALVPDQNIKIVG